MKHLKKILGGVAIASLAIGVVGCTPNVGSTEPVNLITQKEVDNAKKIAYDNGFADGESSVVPIKETVIEEVEVDSGNLKLVLDHIYDNDGSVEYLLDDLDDDEVDQIAERIVFINEIKKLAVDTVKADGIDELDREEVDGERLDEDDIERFKVYDEDEDLIIDEVDFEDSDAEVLVDVRFEQDDIEYKATFRVTFKDGTVDDIEVEDVDLRD